MLDDAMLVHIIKYKNNGLEKECSSPKKEIKKMGKGSQASN